MAVTGTAPEQTELVAKTRELVRFARRLGYKPDKLARLITQITA